MIMLSLLGLSIGAIVGIALGGLFLFMLILVVAYVWGTYNSLIKLKNNVEEGYSTMDIYLKKRYDLIPNLVETVKGYAKHEKETLEKVIAARNVAMNATGTDKVKAEANLTNNIKGLFALSENYPALQANTNFMDLQNQLKALEVDIANSRKYYNGVVKQFNNRIQMFPSNLIARLFGFTAKEMYEVANAEQRENVKVQF